MSDPLWAVEDLQDEDFLYIRVHKGWFKNGRVVPGFFRNRPDKTTGAMSTDWNKYSTPEASRERARKPLENAVGRFHVAAVREIPEQVVVHSPIQHHPTLPDNRAHTDVAGPKETSDLDVQDEFSRICDIVLALPDQ